MSGTSNYKKLIEEISSKKVMDANEFVLNIYDNYRKTSDIIERANFALGRKPIFKANIGSTLDCKVDINAKFATTTQEI